MIVLGPQKLPEMARSIGRFMREMRRVANEITSEFTNGLDDEALDDDETTEPVADEDSEAIDAAVPKPSSED